MLNYLLSVNSWKWQSQNTKIFAKLSMCVQPYLHPSRLWAFAPSVKASLSLGFSWPWASQPSRFFSLFSTPHSLLTLSFHPRNILKILASLKKKTFPVTKWLSSSLPISHLHSLGMLLGKGPKPAVPTSSLLTHCSVVWLLPLCPLRLLWLWSPWPFISKL